MVWLFAIVINMCFKESMVKYLNYKYPLKPVYTIYL